MRDSDRKSLSRQLLFSREAADYLGVSVQRLNQLVKAGQLDPVKRSRGGMVFLKEDLDNRQKTTASIGSEIVSSKGMGCMDLKSDHIIRAINYFAIHRLLGYSDKRAEPAFGSLESVLMPGVALIEHASFAASELGSVESEVAEAYSATREGFAKLRADDQVISRWDAEYPRRLSATAQAPPFLFMRGNIGLASYRIVSIVGTRNPTDEGKGRAHKLASLLTKYRVVVASGLARGIDACAHRGALDSGGLTVAVIGTPLTKVYPSENAVLQMEIAQKGLLVSQFAPSAPVQRWHFPMRNAVMSGLSLATVVVEAGETSGALLQADYALKQGRQVFIPESAVDNPALEWPRKYLERAGCHKFSRIGDLMDQLAEVRISQDATLLDGAGPTARLEKVGEIDVRGCD